MKRRITVLHETPLGGLLLIFDSKIPLEPGFLAESTPKSSPLFHKPPPAEPPSIHGIAKERGSLCRGGRGGGSRGSVGRLFGGAMPNPKPRLLGPANRKPRSKPRSVVPFGAFDSSDCQDVGLIWMSRRSRTTSVPGQGALLESLERNVFCPAAAYLRRKGHGVSVEWRKASVLEQTGMSVLIPRHIEGL